MKSPKVAIFMERRTYQKQISIKRGTECGGKERRYALNARKVEDVMHLYT